ncbi:uncharacterized protein F4822DRAFT_425798 [Hypoxylon trugodes]|uniref:uncharacterized protein n=1 Tax=Hypoxylon trugodes TaxID=326681 RepID=UPI0021902DF6|nr:uncharacterized protein F4822DRAFT_425798 [Hypoxylon trugodes]KAI1392596.1 hypothetical protein F4822DRAFT_425798 [Hypoxylon trugodes]
MADNIDIETGVVLNNPTHEGILDNDSGETSSSRSRSEFGACRFIRRIITRFRSSRAESTCDSPEDIFKSMDDYPNGYPRLGAYIATDKNNLIFRRFNYLQARVLLNLQDQLRAYEEELESLDRYSDTLHSSQASDEASRIRTGLLQKIEDKFKTYVSILQHVSYFSLRAEPLETHFKSLKHFYDIHDPLPEKDKYYLYKEDLMAIKPREDTSGFDVRLMKFLLDAPNRFTRRIFNDREHSGRHEYTIVLNARKIMIARGILLGIPLIVLLRSDREQPRYTAMVDPNARKHNADPKRKILSTSTTENTSASSSSTMGYSDFLAGFKWFSRKSLRQSSDDGSTDSKTSKSGKDSPRQENPKQDNGMKDTAKSDGARKSRHKKKKR